MKCRFPLAARTAIAVAILAAAAPNAVLAGGKAEALRIEFKRGAYSAAISDSVRGAEEAEFVLTAKEGQRLTVNVTSVPDKSAVFELLAEGNDKPEHPAGCETQLFGRAAEDGRLFHHREAVCDSQGNL
jgi:hypothetical protein